MALPIIKMYRNDEVITVDSREEKTVQDFIDIGFSKDKLVDVKPKVEVEPVIDAKPEKPKKTKVD